MKRDHSAAAAPKSTFLRRLSATLLALGLACVNSLPAAAIEATRAPEALPAAPVLPAPALGLSVPAQTPVAAGIGIIPSAGLSLPSEQASIQAPSAGVSAKAAAVAAAAPAEPTAQAAQAAPQIPAAAAPSAAPAQAVPAAAPQDDAAVRGKTLLLVGTRGSRPFIIQEAVRVARELGLNLVLLDKPENRPNSAGAVADADFIAAPIDRRDDKTMKSIVDQVKDVASQRKIDYVIAFRSHHAKLVGRIVDATGITGVPGKAVMTADNKALTREALNRIPELAVPSRKVKTVEEARAAYRELGGGKFVMKSNHGENSRFVELGIDSEDKMAAAFQKMDTALRAEAKKKESSDTIFNRYPGILVERMLEQAPGTVEASVELVVRDGKAAFAMVSDTHGIGPKGELAGGSMTFPSQMSQSVQQALIDASVKALEVVGIRDGNARIDIMMTPDGPRVIEVNPYLGGAAIFTAVKLLTGVSLVEWGIRALLGLPLPAMPAANGVIDYRFAASQYSGVIESVDGVDAAKAETGVAHVQVLEGPGDSVAAPIENGFEEWAEVMGWGATFAKAKASAIAAMAKLKALIRKPDGTTAEQKGDYLQPR